MKKSLWLRPPEWLSFSGYHSIYGRLLTFRLPVKFAKGVYLYPCMSRSIIAVRIAVCLAWAVRLFLPGLKLRRSKRDFTRAPSMNEGLSCSQC